jgi:hypothetical protein
MSLLALERRSWLGVATAAAETLPSRDLSAVGCVPADPVIGKVVRPIAPPIQISGAL